MSVYDRTIIQSTTSAVISADYNSIGTITIMGGGATGDVANPVTPWAAGEYAKIQVTHDGANWQDLYIDNVLQQLDEYHTAIEIHGPVKFRLVKSATASAVAIVLWRTEAEK